MLQVRETPDAVILEGYVIDTSPWLVRPNRLSASQARQGTAYRLRKAGLKVEASGGPIRAYPRDDRERALAVEIMNEGL